MELDATAIGICLSIIGCFLFAALEFYKKQDFDISNIALVFLAIFAISAGGELIYAALKGDPKDLPSSWREYLGVAGMVGIGLSINYVRLAILKVWNSPQSIKKSSQIKE